MNILYSISGTPNEIQNLIGQAAIIYAEGVAAISDEVKYEDAVKDNEAALDKEFKEFEAMLKLRKLRKRDKGFLN